MVLSTSLNVQLHVILVGDDEDEEPEVAYEEWDEEMLDDDEDDQEAQQQTTPIKDDDHTPLVMPDAKNNNLPSSEIHQQNKSPTAINTNDAAANNNATGNNNNHAPVTDPVTRQISRVVEEEDEEDKPSTTTTAPAAKQKVLRIFAGNVDVGASYHSVRVTESTSVDELLASAMEKFHISQIETKHHGRSTTNFKNSCVEYFLTVKTRDGDEITLDPKDKPFAIHESLTAHLTTPMPSLTQFRQLASSTDHIRVNSASANKSSNKKKKRSSFVGNSSIQFFMHKRIKRVNAQSGKVHIKVSLMTTSAGTPVTEKLNAIQKITTLGRFGVIKKKKKDAGPSAGSASGKEERIDKLIAIPANISISDLTSTALVKFHIIADENQPHHYRLILSANGKGKAHRYSCFINLHLLMKSWIFLDTLLNSNQILSDVIKDLGEETTNERYFVLHNFNSHLEDQQKQTKLAPPHQRSLSLSSSTSSSSTTSSSANNNNNNGRQPTTSKVFPEINLGGDSTTFYSHHPVMTRLDSNTEVILKRIDAALEAYEKANNHRNNSVNVKKNNSNNSNFPSPMSVSRNESGVDIHLPHGLLRSTALSEKKTQYSLMTTPNTLVLQKVLPADKSTSKPTATAANTAAAANLKNVVSGEEMATLIKYGSQYLDTYDTANKPFSASNRLFMDGDGEKSLSSLDDLEKVSAPCNEEGRHCC